MGIEVKKNQTEQCKQLEHKMKRCEKLGAKQFQKFVLWLEQKRYRFFKHHFPNLPIWFERRCKTSYQKKLKKCVIPSEREHLEKKYQYQVRMFRKEWNHEQNRNYHLNETNPDEFLGWLRWNKKVHLTGLAINVGLIPLTLVGMIFTSGIVTPICCSLLIYQLISAGINFSCINLQDYNYCRIMLQKEKLDRIASRKRNLEIQKYGLLANKLKPVLQKEKELPTTAQIVDSLTTIEDLKAMRELLAKEYQIRPSLKQEFPCHRR